MSVNSFTCVRMCVYVCEYREGERELGRGGRGRERGGEGEGR